jgi:hypothetical protein
MFSVNDEIQVFLSWISIFEYFPYSTTAVPENVKIVLRNESCSSSGETREFLFALLVLF